MTDQSTSPARHAAPGRPLRIAVTGHRQLRGEGTAAFVSLAVQTILTQLGAEHPEGLCALSGLAEGADTLFAEQALELGVPLEALIAAEDLAETFAPGPPRAHFLYLLGRSAVCRRLPFAQAGPPAYAALGRALVEQADLLVAIWDGRPAPDDGGTGGVVAYARRRGLPTIHIHTLHHTVTRDRAAGFSGARE